MKTEETIIKDLRAKVAEFIEQLTARSEHTVDSIERRGNSLQVYVRAADNSQQTVIEVYADYSDNTPVRFAHGIGAARSIYRGQYAPVEVAHWLATCWPR